MPMIEAGNSHELRCDAMCRSLLRAEVTPWCFASPGGGAATGVVDLFLARLRHHGMQAIAWQRRSLLAGSPREVQHRLRDAVMERSAWELRDRELLRQVLDKLADAGVDCLLFKGAALAYSLYGNPVWRSRTDADILVREADLAVAEQILAACGYTTALDSESIVFYQRDHVLQAPEGGEHRIDLHWRINNSELLSGLFTHEELFAESVPLPDLGPRVRRTGDVHALLIACFHRKVHARYTRERYHWLLDIDQLARHLPSEQWQRVIGMVQQKGLSASMYEALDTTRELLHAPIPGTVLEHLASATPGPCDDYLAAGALRRSMLDLRCCVDHRARLTHLRRLLLPSCGYMLSKYQDARWRWLPWLHMRRVLSGALKCSGLTRGHS